jgi:hypothetical protein
MRLSCPALFMTIYHHLNTAAQLEEHQQSYLRVRTNGYTPGKVQSRRDRGESMPLRGALMRREGTLCLNSNLVCSVGLKNFLRIYWIKTEKAYNEIKFIWNQQIKR